jgi:CheY-like chemotaxis protein
VGFRHITIVQDFHEIPELVHAHNFDLITLDVTQNTEKLCGIIRALREGKHCTNPFAHVVLMTWKLDNEVVRRALNCGADEFITRPFSVAFLGARIKTATESRAPFVVTGDYIGPDRRRDRARRGNGVPTFIPPNALAVKCSDAYDSSIGGLLKKEIEAAREQVGADRIRRGSAQMPYLVPALRQAFTDMDALEPHLAHLMVIAKDTLDRAEHARLKPIIEAAKPLVQDIAGAMDGANVAAHIDGIEQWATKLYAAANPAADLTALQVDLERLRADLAKR